MRLKFFVFQKDTKVGAIKKNFESLKSSYEQATKKKCDFFLTSELSLSGYPPKDLLLRDDFIAEIKFFQKKIFQLTANQNTTIILGSPYFTRNKLFNSSLIISRGILVKRIDKVILPNYGVFDEKRYFNEGILDKNPLLLNGIKVKIFICEDFWNDSYMDKMSFKAIDLIIVINASPYEKDKFNQRLKLVKRRIKHFKTSVIYVNLVGGQDDLVFDGGSFGMTPKKKIIFEAPFFKPYSVIQTINFKKLEVYKTNQISKYYNTQQNLYNALVLSLRDYLKGVSLSKLVIGLSGGIDSALSATIAVDAIGKGNVLGFFMPSKFSSIESKKDAFDLAKNLNIKIKTIPINELYDQYLNTLSNQFVGLKEDITEENIQSRIRGSILMSLSNKFNYLLLTTGNKSELAVGYSTLYGDMCGGFSVLKDLYKTEVFKLSKWRNENYTDLCINKKLRIIPKNSILKEPTAELKFNQKDSDHLPDYEILDKILYYLIEENMGLSKIEKKGFNKEMIKEIWKMLKKSEFKRFQSVIGPKVSKMHFDSDRRVPIINEFKLEKEKC